MNIDKIHFKRRSLVKAALGGLALGSLPACSPPTTTPMPQAVPVVDKEGKAVAPWVNWSGNQHCQPSRRFVPETENKLVDLIKASDRPMRIVGAGHSFSPLIPTEESLISLARIRGIEKIHQDNKQVDILGGTRLAEVGPPLWEAGLALENMPDINTQAFAGALATSTHGTGKRFGSMSSTVTRLRLINARGELIECDADSNSELFQAACTSLGALGAITSSRIQLVDAYQLKEHSWMMSLEEGLERAEELRDNNRNFEMYALPHGDYILGITLNESDDDSTMDGRSDNGGAYEAFRSLSKIIDLLPFMRSFIVNMGARSVEEETRVGRSYEIYGNIRDIRFNEMEYSIPAEQGVACLREILTTIKKNNIDIVFPLEYRYVKADDIWLSPFYQRDSCSISCHNFHDLGYQSYFSAIEPIFWKYGGRPHWGKIHTLGNKQLAGLYPKWNDFLAVRKEMDPKGLFLNKHLKQIFNI